MRARRCLVSAPEHPSRQSPASLSWRRHTSHSDRPSGSVPLTVLCRRPLRSQSLLAISLLPVIRQCFENTTHFSSFFQKNCYFSASSCRIGLVMVETFSFYCYRLICGKNTHFPANQQTFYYTCLNTSRFFAILHHSQRLFERSIDNVSHIKANLAEYFARTQMTYSISGIIRRDVMTFILTSAEDIIHLYTCFPFFCAIADLYIREISE